MPDQCRIFPHTADIGLRVKSRTLNGLFVASAQGMVSLLYDPDKVRVRKRVPVRVRADTPESLLVNWLQEILFQVTVKHAALTRFKVEERGPGFVQGYALGEPLKSAGLRLNREIKAVTYHNLRIRKSRGFYRVELILDI